MARISRCLVGIRESAHRSVAIGGIDAADCEVDAEDRFLPLAVLGRLEWRTFGQRVLIAKVRLRALWPCRLECGLGRKIGEAH